MEEPIIVLRETNLLHYFSLLALPFLILILKQIKSRSNLPPGPFPWPIIGNILNMGNKPHISLARLANSHGPLISLRLGTQLVVVGSSPAAATEILKTHDRTLSARCVPHAIPVYPDQIHLSMAWVDCNDQWRYLRTLCRTELFSAKVIESQASVRDKKTNELVKFLVTKDGKLVKIGELVFATIFNMLSNIFVSKDFISLEEESEDGGMKGLLRRSAELVSTPNLADFYPILSGLDLQGITKKSKEMFEQIIGAWRVITKQRREDNGNDVLRQRDFLDSLLDSELDDNQINYLIQELFLAGADTSTSTVEWAMAELIKNPKAMRKVCAELERETSGHIVKESDLPHLPYLHSTVNETLRLHPPAPFLLPHRALETCKVLNYTIPKDSQVLVNAWAIGRDPSTWEDPLSFKPERFLDSGLDLNSSNFKFIPFGAGRRICPGLPVAAKQVTLILACLINCFDWSLPHDMLPSELDMDDKFGITLQKEKPLLLIPKVRKV